MFSHSEKLEEGPGLRRVEALVLIGQLHIMTAKLLRPFLLCLNDNYVAVRKQGCHTAGELMMTDSMVRVMESLLYWWWDGFAFLAFFFSLSWHSTLF